MDCLGDGVFIVYTVGFQVKYYSIILNLCIAARVEESLDKLVFSLGLTAGHP